MNVIDCKTLADLYQQLGATYWCSRNTEGWYTRHHRERTKKWLALITEARSILLDVPIVDQRAFRKLLVKYFAADLMSQVPYIAGLRYPSDWLNEELCKDVVEKWVNGEYDVEEVTCGM
jgi:hypothetical protein